MGRCLVKHTQGLEIKGPALPFVIVLPCLRYKWCHLPGKKVQGREVSKPTVFSDLPGESRINFSVTFSTLILHTFHRVLATHGRTEVPLGAPLP